MDGESPGFGMGAGREKTKLDASRYRTFESDVRCGRRTVSRTVWAAYPLSPLPLVCCAQSCVSAPPVVRAVAVRSTHDDGGPRELGSGYT